MHAPLLRSIPWLRVTFTVLTVLMLDQLTKAWVLSSREQLEGATPAIGFTFQMNPGILFSVPVTGAWAFVLAGAVLLLVLPLLVRSLNFRHPASGMILGAVIAGALGNLVDRVRFGAVVDFVKIGWWPAFNIADSAIVVAVLACLVFSKRVFHPDHAAH